VIVVDASVLASALGDDGPEGDIARTALRGHRSVNAPALIDAETVAVLRRLWLTGTLSDAQFGRAVDDLVAIPIVRHPMTRLALRAFALRANATAYDAMYVALAEALECVFVTRDRRLSLTPGVRCPVVVVS
jgi:predicted nucleic acid-binding protein